tara:strand:+ start:592 stop:711 length:120 start_codon:yes stop_codon:yes gene_type:complete
MPGAAVAEATSEFPMRLAAQAAQAAAEMVALVKMQRTVQ